MREGTDHILLYTYIQSTPGLPMSCCAAVDRGFFRFILLIFHGSNRQHRELRKRFPHIAADADALSGDLIGAERLAQVQARIGGLRILRRHPPEGQYFALYRDMLKQPHLLIAGATGSGKSVVINGLVYTALYDSHAAVQFIMIDPKRVELVDYKPLPHTVQYASEPGEMVQALEKAMEITETRYREMQVQRVKKYSGAALYVIIDELADLMTTDRRHVQPLLQRLAQIGRAANVHIIAATQCPLAAVIPTPIKVNFDARVALRTRSAQDSRNILGVKGCELLPRYGQGYYMTPDGLTLYNIPMQDPASVKTMLDYWKRQKPRLKWR